MLPARCDVLIQKGSWEVLPIFQLLQARGGVAERELYQVFNMGIGMVLITAPEVADRALRTARKQQHAAWIVGEVVKGQGPVRMV